MEIVNGVWKHIKSGHLYIVTGTVINCTNAQDRQVLVLYQRGKNHYAREIKEFLEKFTLEHEI